MNIIPLIKDVQVNDTQTSWIKLFETLKPLINSFLLNTNPQYRQDLKQELYIETIKAVRNFKINSK